MDPRVKFATIILLKEPNSHIVVTHAFKPCTWEAWAEESLLEAHLVYRVGPTQPNLYRETLFQNKRNIAIKWLLITYCYRYISVHHSVLIKNVSSCSRCKLTQNHPHNWKLCIAWSTLKHSSTNRNFFLNPLFSGLRNLCRWGGRMIARARGGGRCKGKREHFTNKTRRIYIWTHRLQQHAWGLNSFNQEKNPTTEKGKITQNLLPN